MKHSIIEILEVVPSMSDPSKTYEIRRGHDGNVYCQCKAWKFQRVPASQRTCKHLVAFFARQASLPTEAEPVIARTEAVELLVASGDKKVNARKAREAHKQLNREMNLAVMKVHLQAVLSRIEERHPLRVADLSTH
jgi:hypothetical protein